MNTDSHRPIVFGTQIIAVLFVVAVLVGQRAELRSQRPEARQDQVFRGDESLVLRARLWDDPFRGLNEAVAKNSEGDDWDGGGQKGLAESMFGDGAAAEGKTLILVVALDGRSTPDAEELRLRSRYAVVSALTTAGYRSASESKLRVFAGQGNLQDHPLHEKIVWERFVQQEIRAGKALEDVPNPLEFNNVYVCWTRSEELPSDLIINEFSKEFLSGVENGEKIQLVIFDLGDSDRLREFHENSGSRRANLAATVSLALLRLPLLNWLFDPALPAFVGSIEALWQAVPFALEKQPDLFFLRATLSNWLLDAELNWKETSWQRSKDAMRLAIEDVYLVDILLEELSHRLPKPGRIVLFTESDSTYSQGIAQELRNAINKRRSDLQLEVFTYLRGIDGRRDSSLSKTAKEDASKANPIEALTKARVLTEESSGTSQFDYLRREAMQLRLEHREKPVIAVGVMGSDVYDKLIVLQALRPELPQAVFFTTDLDALYLHADNIDVTRNLIVASANDLQPDHAIEEGEASWTVPPMRDSYQNILFEATRDLVLRGGKLQDVTQEVARPLLFEIAAGRAVKLYPRSKEEKLVPANHVMMKVLAFPGFSVLIFALAIGNGILVLRAVCSRASFPGELRWANHLLTTESVVAGLAIFILAILFIVNGFWGAFDFVLTEPLSWTLGVSIWPTILIRCVAFLVALQLMIKAAEDVEVKFRHTRNRLCNLIGPDAHLPSTQLSRETVFDFVERRLLRLGPKERKERTVKEFLDTIDGRSDRIRRVTVLAVIYFAVSVFLFAIFPTYTPGRGFAVLLMEKVVLALAMGLYIVQFLYCLYLHLGARALLQALRDYLAKNEVIDQYKVLNTAGDYTAAVGRTLHYPLTVLIILMLSRIRLFDAWSMAPSLWIVLGIGAIVLTVASLVIASEGRHMRNEALERERVQKHTCVMEFPSTSETRKESPAGATAELDAIERRMQELRELHTGAFSLWYQQPVFAALVSLVGVLGAVGFAEPIVDLLIG